MNSAARVIRAVFHRPSAPPIPRGELTVDREFARKLLLWRGEAAAVNAFSDADLLIACCRALALDLVCIQSGKNPNQGAGLSLTPADIRRFLDQELFVFWVVEGSFQRAMTRRGSMALFLDIVRSPDTVCQELQRLSSRVTAAMARGITAGAQGIIVADDIAYSQSTYMPPDFVRQHLLPLWQAQVTTARELGVPVFFHSDGNLNAVLPTIAAAGFDGLQCIEPAAGMDLPAIRTEYGNRLCLMGNVDPALLSGQGNQDEIESRCKRLRRTVLDLMASAGGNGGYIFGTCSGLHAGMSPELVHYMYRLASEPATAFPRSLRKPTRQEGIK